MVFSRQLLTLSIAWMTTAFAVAQDAANDRPPREERLAEYLNGVKLIGQFTIDGIDTEAKTEAYTISKCEKLPEPDMYQMTARITYGEVDSELPLKIKILWAGNTPVITLDKFWIPGMGTFGARVLIHSDRYAGTWQHDEVGGNMFGRIERLDDDPIEEGGDQKPVEGEPAP